MKKNIRKILLLYVLIAGVSFAFGFFGMIKNAKGQEQPSLPLGDPSSTSPVNDRPVESSGTTAVPKSKASKIVYPKNTKFDFEGATIDGEVKNPGEFYFQHRPEERFDSLIKRRKNFHREMLRDAVLGR